MKRRDREDLKLHFTAINRFTNSQNQQEHRLWKMTFWSYFRWSIVFSKTHYVREKKNDREKSRKHAKLWGKKIEELWNSILEPLTASPTLRINKKTDFEKWDFVHIFDDPSFFEKLTMFEEKKRSWKNRENMPNYEAKR